jgi:hypothetical protein
VKKPLTPSQLIDARIEELGDWRGKTLARLRAIVKAADPEIVEEWKWRGVPVWYHGSGIICTGETYKEVVKTTFAKGASLDDPAGVFNSSLDGNTRRAIDFREGEKIDEKALKALVRAAIALNSGGKTKAAPRKAAPKAKATKSAPKAKRTKPVLLAGGNPQVSKADGNAPVQAYIAAVPGWKRDVSRRLDALIVRTVPGVSKAVKWNSPFYGVEGQGWFLSFHVFTNYVKVTFFKGTSLQPAPSGGTGKEGRWIDIHEDDMDEAQLTAWIRQAAAIPGWMA